MELQIGSQLRELRRRRNLTQEEVAAHLGISFQAVSKWERGEGYPDITMLPALAAYFEVSVDELLGVNSAASQGHYEALNRQWEEQNLAGRHLENAELMRQALRERPNDPLLLVQLSTSLEKIGGTDAEHTSYLRESAAVQEQILTYCQDSFIHGATQFNICFTYQKLGQTDRAQLQAEKLPNLYKTRENALVCLLDGQEKYRAAESALEPLQWAVRLHLGALAELPGREALREQAEVICHMLAEANHL